VKRVISSEDYYTEIEEEEVAETQTGVELKLANGNVIKAATYEEALKVAVKMTEDTQAALKAERDTWKAEKEAMDTRLNEIAAQIPKPKVESTNGFDSQRYWTLLNSDPIAAQNYLDSHRFGIDNPDAVPGYFTHMNETISNVDQKMLAAEFIYMHEEFPAGDKKAAAIVTKQVQELVNAGHPANIDTMNLAWEKIVQSGDVKPLEVKTEEMEEANPSLGGSGGAEIIPDDKFAAMSTREMEAYLKSQGRL
jgi:hypothetical protein